MGWPWENAPWEYDHNPKNDILIIKALQAIEQQEKSTGAVELLGRCSKKIEDKPIEGKDESQWHRKSLVKSYVLQSQMKK